MQIVSQNNAGFASVAPLLDADIEKMEEMIALNIIALTRLTYAAAPAFVKRGTGTIINIGSAAGISVEALNGVYGASKAYALAFSLSLQHELTAKASASKQCYLVGPRPTVGRSPASHGNSNPRRSSCRWKTWSMQRWSA
jgi:short-subunit dehydrogenase